MPRNGIGIEIIPILLDTLHTLKQIYHSPRFADHIEWTASSEYVVKLDNVLESVPILGSYLSDAKLKKVK